MARDKEIDTHPKFLPVELARQLLPGTFEQALNHLLDHELELSALDARTATTPLERPPIRRRCCSS